MNLKPLRPWLALSLGTTMLAGCQTSTPLFALKQPLFALGQAAPAAPVAVAGQVTDQQGALTVNFQGDLARLGLARQRRVLATLSDVDHVTVTVKAAGGAEFSKTVDKAAIANGTTSVTFDALPVGLATLTVSVFNAAGAAIGSAVKPANVTAGQVVSVNVAVQLAPSYTGPSGGGMGASTGGLTTNVSLVNGPSFAATKPGDILGTSMYGDGNWSIAVDGSGNAWVGSRGQGNTTDPTSKSVFKLAPDGTLLKTVAVQGPVTSVQADSQGNAWVLIDESPATGPATCRITKLAPDGTQLATLPHVGGAGQLAVAPDDTVYAFTESQMLAVSAQGTLSGEYQAPYPAAGASVLGAAVDPVGNVWVANLNAGTVYKLSPQGVKLAEAHLPLLGGLAPQVGHIAIDGAGQVWAPATPQGPALGIDKGLVVKLAPDGTVLGQYAVGQSPAAVTVDPWGFVWVLDNMDLTVRRLRPDGTALATCTLPIHGQGLASGRSGLWIGELMGAGVTRLAL